MTSNPDSYLVLTPLGLGREVFPQAPGTKFDAWDASATLDDMPIGYVTWRLEFIHRAADVCRTSPARAA